jgi:hypothetical protein
MKNNYLMIRNSLVHKNELYEQKLLPLSNTSNFSEFTLKNKA